MSQTARFSSLGGALLALCVALSGCAARTDVYGGGSTPSQYTHIFITAQQIWFNTSASAGVDDSGWAKFTLTSPMTFDLVTDSNGTLGEIADDLHLTAGTYNSILIIPVPSESTQTAASATALGATYNLEADYVDSSGTTHAVPLIVPNPEKGIVIPASQALTVPFGSIGLGTTTSGTTSTAATGTTSTTSTTSTNSTSSTSSTQRVSFASNFDGNRDLHMFTYPAGGTNTGVMLSSNPSSSNLATTGAISGTLTLTSLTNITAISDRVAIQASAETLSADGSHHVIVATAPVQTDGTFTIYPLPSNSSTATNYDVVIHGPNIATIIIKSVPATTSSPSTSASSSTTNTATAGSPVSIGTFIPRQSVSSSGTTTTSTTFTASVNPTTSASLPPGAAVVFYQTLPASGEVPYAIDEIGIDPLNLNLTGEALSGATIDVGTYTSSGSTITVTAATPVEAQGVYKVGATAPLYNDSALSSTYQVSASKPAVSLPTLTPAAGSSTVSFTANVSSSGAYDQGELIVSHNGAVVGTASLASVLKGGTLTVSGLPGGGDAKYYLSAIVWNSGSPGYALAGTGSFKYESFANPVDLSGGNVSDVAITIE